MHYNYADLFTILIFLLFVSNYSKNNLFVVLYTFAVDFIESFCLATKSYYKFDINYRLKMNGVKHSIFV